MDCIFCKFVTGEIPVKKLYENEGAVAFLDISPLSKGHSLVIPKKHFVKSFEMDSQAWASVADAISQTSKLLVEKLGIKDYNILQNNGKLAHQEVQHVHFHIIPKTDSSGLEIKWNPIKIDTDSLFKFLVE
ncbi:MAG: HIT family protein [Candidatus Altiarchaeota archaeon]|nr:HIT family protein [Candidatus Altiarchaeota archaeon]